MVAAGCEGTSRGSRKFVTVTCDWQATPHCTRLWTKQWGEILRDREAGDGSDVCVPCSHATWSTGLGCCHHVIDVSFLQEIDSEAKAYLLGWVAKDGALTEDAFSIQAHQRDVGTLRFLRDMLSRALPIVPTKDHNALRVTCKPLIDDARRHLGGSSARPVEFPQMIASDDLRWAFLRGLFDADGEVSVRGSNPACSIVSSSRGMREAIKSFAGIPCVVDDGAVRFRGTSAIDLMGRLYEPATLALTRKLEAYRDCVAWMPSEDAERRHATMCWRRMHPDAVPPAKARTSDAGYDVTLIGDREEDRGKAIRLYRTGICVAPPHGFYFDLVPRSSISKTGYMMANSFGVIDRSYRGELLVPLIKVVPEAPDLTFPNRIAQLVLRQAVHVGVEELDDLEETARGDGGFGASGMGSTRLR